MAALAEKNGFRVQRRSAPAPDKRDAEVLILDTLGELAAAYQFATVVFVGGTLIPHGGQSIMEPALYAKPIVVGPSMKNFAAIMDDFLARGGVSQIAADEKDKEAQKKQLTEAFTQLLGDKAARETMGAAARSVFEGSKGATQFTVDRIAAIYEEVRKKMSDVLARIRVKETHGIRRFLYPLSAIVTLPGLADIGKIGLADTRGEAVPLRLVAEDAAAGPNAYRLDFAVFLDPLSETELTLSYGGLHTTFDDPLQISRTGSHGWQSVQKRFRLETDADGAIERVVYDGVEHLRGRASITRNGAEMRTDTSAALHTGLRFVLVSRRSLQRRRRGADYARPDRLQVLGDGDAPPAKRGRYESVDFTLPFALTSPTPTYDLGIGNGIYGKLPAGTRLAHRLRQSSSCPVVGHDRRTPRLCGNGDSRRISVATLVPFD